MQRNRNLTRLGRPTGRLVQNFSVGASLTLMLVAASGCPGPDGDDAGPDECVITFSDPRNDVILTTAADDNDEDASNGIQFDVRVTTDCENGTSVTLFNEENGEEATGTVDGETLVFSDFTIDASPNPGTENILRVVASPTGVVATDDIITVTGIDDGGNEDPTCTFTAPADGATVEDADVNAPNFQIATAVRCTNTQAGDEVEIQAGDDAGLTVSLDASGNASAIVTTTQTEGSVALVASLVETPAVRATINVTLGADAPDCDATIDSPADGTAFGAGSPDQSADDGFQILVRVSTDPDCSGGTATVSVGGNDSTETVGPNGEADFIVTIEEGASTISASVELNGNTGAADTVNVTYTPGAIGMTFDVPTCGTFGDGCFNAAVGDSVPGTPTIEQDITVFAPAIGGACPYTDPTITVDGGPSVGGATWTFNSGEDRCEATFGDLTLTDVAAPDGEVVVLVVTATTNDGQTEDATFNLGLDFVAAVLDVQVPVEGAQINEADDPNLTDGYQVNFQVLTPGLRDGAQVSIVFSADGQDDVTLPCVVGLGSCEVFAELGDGDWTANITATDEAGNVSTFVRSFAVDSTRPVVSAITLSLDANDDGQVNFAEAGAAPLTGTVTVATDLEAGTSVGITVDGTAVAAVQTAADGSATFTGVSIPEGTDIEIIATGADAFGNPFAEGTPGRAWSIDVTLPVIAIAAPNVDVDLLLLADDDVLPGVAGMQIDFAVATDEPGASVTLSDAGGAAATETADGTGLALFSGFLLAEGTASVTATVTDAAGNTSTTPAYEPTVDSIRPELTITSPADGFVANSANDNDGILANGLQVTVTVETVDVPVGEAVCIDSDIDGEIGCAPAEADGNVDIEVTFLTEATHEVTARAFDANTNSGTSPAISVDAVTGIYSLSVVTPELVNGVRGMGADEDTDGATPGAQTQICVDAGENLGFGTTFQLFVNGVVVAAANFDENPSATGACETVTFADGTSGTFEVTIADLAGKTGTSGVQNFAVDLAVPTVSITAPTAGAVLNIASDANGAIAGLQFDVAYTTDKAGSLVVIDSDGATIGGPVDVTAGAGTIGVSDGTDHDAGDWTVRVTDAVGNEGEATVNVTVDATAPDIGVLSVELENRRAGLLRAVFLEPGDDGVDGANVASLEVVASLTAISNDAEFDAALALDGSPGQGGPFEVVNIDGAGTAHSDVSRPLAYGKTWTVAVRAIDDAGNSSIVSGTSDEIATVLTIRADTEDDVSPNGVATEDQFGFLSLGNGDINGDGTDDLLVASPSEGDECLFVDFCRGRLRVFLGGADVDGNLTLAPAEITDPGVNTSLYGFLSLSIVPSLNGDAFDDVVAFGYADDFSEFVDVLYGQGAAPYLDAANRVRFTFPSNHSVLRVSSIGDVNNDDQPDLAVITRLVGSPEVEQVFVIFGTGTDLVGPIDVGIGGPNVAILSSTNSGVGFAMTGLGDVTGDGIDDFAIDGAAPDNRIYVVPGRETWPDSSVGAFVELDGLPGPTCVGDCGAELSSGDLNGDGRTDLVALDISSTRVFLQNTSNAFPATQSYSLLVGGGRNTTVSRRGGLAVSDINGDGFDDVFVTARARAAPPVPSGFGLFFGDARISVSKTAADTFYEVPFVQGDGANIGACGNLNGSADGLSELCFGISYTQTGIDGQVRIRD